MGGAPEIPVKEAHPLPEPEVVAPVTAPALEPAAQPEPTTPEETALTRTEIAALIAANGAEVAAKVQKDLDAAYKAARRSESKGDAANAKIAKLEAQLEVLATRGMDENEAKLWKAERALERANETTQQTSQQQEYEQAARSFQERSTAFLTSEGIKSDDPVLTESFKKYAEGAKSYNDWDAALMRAVADVHKGTAKRTADEAKTAVEKAREEERAKLRNEQREKEGPIDKGQPAAQGRVDFSKMTDEEFRAFDAQRDVERRRRLRQSLK